MTSELLVRKGEAAPSVLPEAAKPFLRPRLVSPPGEKFVFVPDETGQHSSAKADPDGHGEKVRRIVLGLSAHEYETLGLVAVKKGSTRHALAQEAMTAYFEWIVSEYGEACNCITGGALCRCECGQAK
jgi:hypothetical protein